MMIDEDKAFHNDIKRALTNFHDLPYLRQHPLTHWLPPHLAFSTDHGKALQQCLQEAVQHLKSVGTPSEVAREWRPYFALYYRYIKRLSRREVMGRLGVSESEFHRQQRKAIAAVADYLKQSRTETRPPPVQVEPIPRLEHFVGRREELAYYCRRFEAEDFVLISGMAGVGKTSLGAELVSRWQERNNVVWFRFRRGRNTTLEAVLEGLALSLAALGRDEYWRFLQVDRQREPPLSPDTRIRYLINVLAGKNYTLCFDNFELVSSDTVLNSLFGDLLTSAQAGKLRLLVMSRVRPAFAAGHPVRPLGGLGQEDARRLLAAAGLPPLPETTFAQLYDKTGGAPVFLKLFATWVHSQEPALSETKGLLDLGDDRARGQIETFVEHLVRQHDVRYYLLREVYDTLSPVEQRFLEITSAFRLLFDEQEEGIVRLLAAEGIEDVGHTLDRLADRHLFTLDEAGIFHLHPLVKEYCNGRLAVRPADKTRVHGRLAAYYEEQDDPLEAAHHYDQAGERQRAATLLTANLQRLIDAGQGQAALEQLEGLTSRLARRVDAALRFELAAARERLYDLLGQREKQRSALRSMLALAGGLSDDPSTGSGRCRRLALAHNRWGRFHEVMGDYEAAIEAAQAGQAAARRAGDRQAEAESLNHWGRALHRRGEYAAAREQLEKALGHARVVGNGEAEAASLNNLGIVCWALGNYRAAEGYFQQSLAIQSTLGDRRGQASNLNNLGIVCQELGDYGVALGYLEQSLTIRQAMGDSEGEATSLINLSNVYRALGDYERAQDYCKQSLVIHRAIGDQRGESISLGNLGLLHCHRDDYGAAQDYCRQALDIARTIGDPRGSGYYLTYLGMALEGLPDWPAAKTAYTEALAIRREIGQRALAIDSLAGLGRVALARSRKQEAGGKRQEALEEASRCAKECLAHIAAHGVAGIEYPIVVYHTCARILEACEEQERAREVLATAHVLLSERAEKISDLALRRSFLENVPAHRALLEA